ncbi:HET-domain-containing protein, partial [Lophium mytilinum]
MVRQWLEDSDEAHPLRGTESEQNYDRLPSNFRVIDVQRRCLVEHRHQYRYVALSYVWGSSHMLKTTKSTFHQLSIDGAFNNSKTKLPEVVESALEFLQGLSERYLWVDALCIVQDDEVDVLNQISRMDAIYSSSYATLIAAAGTSSQSRLLGLPNSPRIVKQSMETIQGETYIAQSPTLGDKLLETVWYTRGWTYQEHELSSRRIFVFDDEFFFENENTIHCESSWRSENALAQTLEAPWGTATSTSNKDYVNYFVSFFFNKVNDYTRRNLTYPNDILNAFAGLCMSLQNNGKIKIRSGLPLESLHQGLFWDTARISSRRLSTFSHQGSTWIFPSWSWIGWTGIIRHDSSR